MDNRPLHIKIKHPDNRLINNSYSRSQKKRWLSYNNSDSPTKNKTDIKSKSPAIRTIFEHHSATKVPRIKEKKYTNRMLKTFVSDPNMTYQNGHPSNFRKLLTISGPPSKTNPMSSPIKMFREQEKIAKKDLLSPRRENIILKEKIQKLQNSLDQINHEAKWQDSLISNWLSGKPVPKEQNDKLQKVLGTKCQEKLETIRSKYQIFIQKLKASFSKQIEDLQEVIGDMSNTLFKSDLEALENGAAKTIEK